MNQKKAKLIRQLTRLSIEEGLTTDAYRTHYKKNKKELCGHTRKYIKEIISSILYD